MSKRVKEKICLSVLLTASLIPMHMHISALFWHPNRTVHTFLATLHFLPALPYKVRLSILICPFYFLPILPPLLAWETRVFCLWKKKSIVITWERWGERETHTHTRAHAHRHARSRRRNCYPCQFDPCWWLSSHLIALLISSPLSPHLGQSGPHRRDDWGPTRGRLGGRPAPWSLLHFHSFSSFTC